MKNKHSCAVKNIICTVGGILRLSTEYVQWCTVHCTVTAQYYIYVIWKRESFCLLSPIRQKNLTGITTSSVFPKYNYEHASLKH